MAVPPVAGPTSDTHLRRIAPRTAPGRGPYNPFTNTVHIYSDDAAVILHEAGHADDFAKQPYPGIYATLRLLPIVDLYQEYVATDTAITYLISKQDRKTELHAYKILYPAYGTYVGAYIPPYGSLAGALVGHVLGRSKAHSRARMYDALDQTHAAREEKRRQAAIRATIDRPASPEVRTGTVLGGTGL